MNSILSTLSTDLSPTFPTYLNIYHIIPDKTPTSNFWYFFTINIQKSPWHVCLGAYISSFFQFNSSAISRMLLRSWLSSILNLRISARMFIKSLTIWLIWSNFCLCRYEVRSVIIFVLLPVISINIQLFIVFLITFSKVLDYRYSVIKYPGNAPCQ